MVADANVDQNNGLGAFLNRVTGNILDWNRVGELLKSGSHNYNFEEVYIRILIFISSLIGTYVLGTSIKYFFNDLKSEYVYVSAFLISASVCHGIAIEKLIMKRLAMKAEIEELKNKIIEMIPNIQSLQEQQDIQKRLSEILVLEAKNNASSATLGMRKRLLSELLDQIGALIKEP
jgi:hypothetical protein